jgi:hypothetical protein
MFKIFDNIGDPITINNIKVSCLMYADAIVLISESAKGLQNCLNKLSKYYDIWNLSRIIDKPKVIIFNKSGRVIKKDSVKYMEYVLEITQEYKYIGVLFKPSGSFTKANAYICKKARKALLCIYKTLCSDKLSILPNLKLFDSCVKPMLLYYSEIMCLDTLLKNNVTMESRYFLFKPVKVQNKFAKYILGDKKKLHQIWQYYEN